MSKKNCVIGGGPGGYVAAIRLAQLGIKDVVLIEKKELGGTCLNYGCIPSKIMKASSSLYAKTKEFQGFGIIFNSAPSFDISILQSKKSKILDIQRKGIKSILEHLGIEIIKGSASFKDEETIQITNDDGQRYINFQHCIVAAGTIPAALPGFEFNHENVLSSDDLLDLESIPESIAIVGGGIIGCEFASILSELGSKVTIIEAMDRLLPLKGLDRDISKNLEREFKKQKIKIHKNCLAEYLPQDSNMQKIKITEKGKDKEILCEKIAVCTGRSSVSNSLSLENAGVNTDEKGWVITDKDYRTSNRRIYAIGDILGPEFSMLAHTASFEGRIAAERIADKNETILNYDNIPGAVFTSPEIGFIGLSEDTAKEKGIEIIKEKVLFRTSGKAHAIGEIAGEAILIADENSKEIVGIHMIGAHASDLLGEASVIVQNNIDFKSLANTVHAHPTLSEILMETGLKLSGMGIHG